MPKKRSRLISPGGADQPKYSITTAAELTGVHPQQLRRFEKVGMLSPARSPGGTRRYSDADLAQVARIRDLSDAGVNEAGIEQILALQDALQASEARAAAAEARAQAAEAHQAKAAARKKKKRPRSDQP
jgi:DNA-binding transcriptional MerR regulator